MFRPLRRIKNEMNYAESSALLKRAHEGILGTKSVDHEYPYPVVVNYVYANERIYIHSAKEGHKIDNILHDPHVSFTVYDSVQVNESEFTTKYQSVMIFGQASIIKSTKEILMKFIEKYSPNHLESGALYVNESHHEPLIMEIKIDYLSGKKR